MVIKMEAHPDFTREDIRQEMVDRIFGEMVVNEVMSGGIVDMDSTWETQVPTEYQKKVGIRVARLCCEEDGHAPVRIEQSENWTLDTPGVTVVNGDNAVFTGTIDNALNHIEKELGYNL